MRSLYFIENKITQANGRKNLKLTAVLIGLVFSIPILIIFGFMLSFKYESISKAKSELQGTRETAKLFDGIQNLYFNQIQKQTQIVANNFKLSVDNDLDSHYLIDVLTVKFPTLFSYMGQLQNLPPESEKQKTLLILIKDTTNGISQTLQLAMAEDANFNSVNEELQSKIYFDSFNKVLKKINSSVQSQNKAELDRAYVSSLTFWHATNKILQQLLTERLESLTLEKNTSVVFCIFIWFLSFFSVFRIASKLEMKIKPELAREVAIQNLASPAIQSSLLSIHDDFTTEMNNPLTAARLNSEMLMNKLAAGTLSANDTLRIAKSIIKSIDKINKLVESWRQQSVATHDEIIKSSKSTQLKSNSQYSA